MTKAGQLDVEVRIYRKVGTKNPKGEIQYEEELFDTDWARREDLTTIKDNERMMDKIQTIAFGVTRWTFRYRTDLLPSMIIVDEDDRRYQIVSEPYFWGRRQFVSYNTEARDND